MVFSAFIDGIGFWAAGLPGWAQAAAAMRGDGPSGTAAPARPAAARLPPNERRRAPDAVLLAVEVAQAAVEASGREASSLASVFTSAHGDLAVIDALCSTLASAPTLLSPTRFHHSVHNAASGYWGIASGSRHASTALAAYGHSFGAGLLEALSLCTAEAQPVLLVGHDTDARGPMLSVNTSRGLLGVALVLTPVRSAASRFALRAELVPGAAATPAATPAGQALAANAQADALPLFEALASPGPGAVVLPVGRGSALRLTVVPLA
jgi:hypothetical protein